MGERKVYIPLIPIFIIIDQSKKRRNKMQAVTQSETQTLGQTQAPGMVVNPGRILNSFFESLPKRNRLVASPLILADNGRLVFNAYLIYQGKLKVNVNLKTPRRVIKVKSRYEKDTDITSIEVEITTSNPQMLIRSFKVLGTLIALAKAKDKA